MADKGAGGYASLFGDVAGGIFEFIGNALAWDAKSRELNYAMVQADENAQIAAAAAADATRRGNIEAAKIRLQSTQLASQQAVAYQNAGIDPTTGTAAEMQGYTASVGETDAQTVENNAAREAWGQNKQAERFTQQRKQLREKYNSEELSYGLNQTGTVVKTATNAWSSALKTQG